MASEFVKNEIKRCYANENSRKLASRLSISEVNLRQIARRLGIKKGTKANRIVEGRKKCSRCSRWLPVSKFWKDKYQAMTISYVCIECYKKSRNKEEPKEKKTKSCICDRVSVGFGKGNKRNKPFIGVDGKLYLKCKGCGEIKLLEVAFSISSNISHGHKNYCKVCVNKKNKEAYKKTK